MPFRALILGGGNALGGYLAGAYEALHEAGEEPEWIAGSSVGAITAALIAGNPPTRRVDRLRAFWRQATSPDWLPWTGGMRWVNPLRTRLLGRPELFHPRLPLPGSPDRAGIYDVTPMRRCLEELIDFEQVNAGSIRLSALAVDLQTGDEVVFDTGSERLTVDHLLASAALIPDFAPVRIGELWLVDGGLAANTPADVVLGGGLSQDTVCYLVDPFPRDAPVPEDVAGMSMRQSDLTFACQTERTLRALASLDRLGPPNRPRVDVVRTSYAAYADETAMKAWDYSETAIQRRWKAGRADMAAALRRFQSLPPGGPGLCIHPIVGA